MSFALVHQASVDFSTNQNTTPLTITAPATGNLLVAIWLTKSNLTITSFTSGGGGVTTWSLAKALNSGTTRRCEIWYGVVDTTPTTTITANHSKSSSQRDLYCVEWSGQAAVTILGTTNSATAASTTMSSGTCVTTNAASLVIAAALCNTAISAGPTGGFTDFTLPASALIGRAAYKVETALETAEDTYTITSDTWVGVIAEFLPSAVPDTQEWRGCYPPVRSQELGNVTY